jgi:hypothetical protein
LKHQNGIKDAVRNRTYYFKGGISMMNRRVFVVLVVMLLVSVLGACSKGYESQKSSAGLRITLKADRYPLVKGDNNLTINVMDSAGKVVSDAKVDIRFYMPPMPGMAPMESGIQTQQKGNEYPFTVDVPMEGGWKIDATVTQPGKAPVTATFNVDAR